MKRLGLPLLFVGAFVGAMVAGLHLFPRAASAQGLAGAGGGLSRDTPVTGQAILPSTVSASGSAPQFICSGTGTCTIQSGISAATASSSVSALSIAGANALDANDLIFDVFDQAAGNRRFSVDKEGDVAFVTATLAGEGTASAPAIAWAGDADTGIYHTADDILFTGAGTRRLTVGASGVLINTSMSLQSGANLSLTGGTADSNGVIQASNTGSNIFLKSAIGATAATTSVAAFHIQHTNGALTAEDLEFLSEDSAGADLMKWDEEGDVTNKGRYASTAHSFAIADNGAGSAATGTLNPTSSYVAVTCSDANGCDITMGETAAMDGSFVHIVNISANAANFADTAGVSELTGAIALGQYDSLTLVYVSDRWVEITTSNN